MQVTARHYAKWMGDGEEYVEPMRLEAGELPCDLLDRVPTESPQTTTVEASDTANPRPSKCA